MNIEFERIEAQNFKSIGDLVTIDYPDFLGLNFVVGNNIDQPGSKNGCGKTVLLVDCLTFALFGRTIKPTANQHLSNNKYTKKADTFAKVTFKVDGVRYRSECYCNKSSQKMLLYIEDNNEESGWKDITQSSIIKTKQYIQDEILKCTFDIFKSAIVISAADCLNFYEGMTKAQKRAYIENIFNLNCFGLMFDNIKTDLNNCKKEISYTNSEILNQNQQLENINQKYQTYKLELQTKSDELKKNILAVATECKTKQAEQQKYKELLDQCVDVSNEYNSLSTNEQNILQEKSKVEREIYKAEAKIESINQVIDEITKIKEGLCEVCTEVVNTRYDYNKQVKGITALNKLIQTDNEKVSQYNNQLKECQAKRSELTVKLQEQNKLETKVSNLTIEINNLKETVKRLKLEFDNAKSNNNPFEDLVKTTENTLKITEEKLNKLNVTYKHLDILRNVCSENGVKQYIIKDIVVLLNSLIQQYLNEIGAEYLVYFDESFDFKFITLSGELEYNSFSAGERQRIQIATLLSFRDLILNGKINSNILIIDEVLDMAIDALAIKRIISILQRKTIDMNQALFIISHRSEITDETTFNHIIEVKKENGISSINII